MADKVLDSFLSRQLQRGMALARRSEILELTPVGGSPPCRYVAEFRCSGLVGDATGVRVADRFLVGIYFPPDYLRAVTSALVLTLLAPPRVWHPNVRGPLVCVGRLTPGTELPDLLHGVYEILTFHKVNMREDDALNPAACAWARANLHRFPLDPRPLGRRASVSDLSGDSNGAAR